MIPCLLAQAPVFARSLPAPALVGMAQGPVAAMQQPVEREPGPADLQEAIEIALERFGGSAASAETVVRDGREVHEIKVLGDDGSVRTVRIDPETGAVIPQERRQD
jgi:uncharacterized membrane protein YkoI